MSLFNTNGLMKVAEFEKVSFNQFEIDCKKSAYFNNKNIEEIYKNIEIPIRKTKGSAGHDIVSPFDFTLLPNESIMIPTGIHCKISTGWVLMIFVRSSLGIKKGIKLANGTGIIDSDYYYANNEGHIFAKIENYGFEQIRVKAGDPILQGVFVPFGVADQDEIKTKRVGGIGSTSKSTEGEKKE